LVLELENDTQGHRGDCPSQAYEGVLVKKVLRENDLVHGEGTNFILCCGDNILDEKMFMARLQCVCAAVLVFRVSGSLYSYSYTKSLTPFESNLFYSLSFCTLPSWACDEQNATPIPPVVAW
jgi:hypothetical protein